MACARVGTIYQDQGLPAFVAIDDLLGKHFAVLGTTGSGKSSLAAAMRTLGHDVVADDVTATRIADGRAEIFPGVPRLRLTPATLDWLGESPEELPPVPGNDDKRAYPVEGFPDQRPIRLARMYSIHEGPAPRIEPLSEREAFLEISRNLDALADTGRRPRSC